jgi:hypothetical protein
MRVCVCLWSISLSSMSTFELNIPYKITPQLAMHLVYGVQSYMKICIDEVFQV